MHFSLHTRTLSRIVSQTDKMLKHGAVAGFALLLCTVGCHKSIEPTPVSGVVAAGTSAEALPVVTETVEQIRARMKTEGPFSPPFEEDRIKLAVLLDPIRKSQGVEGYQAKEAPPELSNNPTAYVDSQTGKIAWRAMACWNPDCVGRGRGGGPLLFTYEISTIKVGADGKLDIQPADPAEMAKPVYCPACKSEKYIWAYDLPETMVREKALKAELDRAYAAYGAAARDGKPMPTDVRGPQDILNEMNSLPKLFLLSEPGKVKQFDAITAPIGGGLASGKD